MTPMARHDEAASRGRIQGAGDEQGGMRSVIQVGDTIQWNSPIFGTCLEGVVKDIIDDNGEWIVIENHPITHKEGRIIRRWVRL